MKSVFLVLCIIIAMSADTFSQGDVHAEVIAVLSAQEAAWNNGDIEKFMEGYFHDDSLIFLGKSGATYGFQKTLERYKKSYPDKEAMGKLSFTFLEEKQLSPDYFFLIGKYELERIAGKLEGHFSLLFKKIEGKWLIIADHSS